MMIAGQEEARMVYRQIDTVVGPLLLGGDAQGLSCLEFDGAGEGRQRVAEAPDRAGVLDAVIEELTAYFAGQLRAFTVPVVLAGTPFQQRVWAALQRIPYGTTTSYVALARQIGSPGAMRAVGLANGANPVAIVVPCHRVIGADGSLTGFGGGLRIKRTLLDLEQGRLPLAYV
jgi:methylated-DNA-[protein]-cysteine S-methyltransferase